MTKKGVYIWTCDHCGKRETWKKPWNYLPGIESDANKLPASGKIDPDSGEIGPDLILPVSFCCPKHADEWLDKRHPIHRKLVPAKAKQDPPACPAGGGKPG